MWEKVLESALLKCCPLLFRPSVSAGGPAARRGKGPGETSLESDEPRETQMRRPQKCSLSAVPRRGRGVRQAPGTELGILPREQG